MKLVPFQPVHGVLFLKRAYPLGACFIIGSRFFERLYFFGLQAIFPLFLVQVLQSSQQNATLYYHIYCMFGSIFPIIAGLLGDSNFGKYRIAFYLLIVYIAGACAIDAASTPFVNISKKSLVTGLGVLAISIGGGCASIALPFGGDQFTSAQPSQQLAQYFSTTYFSDSASNLAAAFVTPILRHDYQCFYHDSCFPLAMTFLVLMLVISLVILTAGRRLYVRKKAERNVIVEVTTCTCFAISRRFSSKEKKTHWLDHAENKYSESLIADTKRAFNVLFLFLLVPVFWALDDQTGSTWVFQAMHMDGSLGWFTIKPDQFQIIDQVMSLLFVPLFDLLIYPLLTRYHLLTRPLERLTLAGLLAAVSFMLAAVLELKIQGTFPKLPDNGTAQLRVFNGLNCNVKFNNPVAPSSDIIPSLEALQVLHVPQKDTSIYPVSFTTSDDCYLYPNYTFSGTVLLQARKASSLFLHTNEQHRPIASQPPGFDFIDKSSLENPKLRIVYNLAPFVDKITLVQKQYSVTYTLQKDQFETSLESISHTGKFLARLGNSSISADIELGPAGIYTLIIYSYNNTLIGRLITVTPPNTVHMLWQLPQYVTISLAEVIFIVTGNELCYTQAPESMKSFIAVIWTMTDAFGNMIVIAVVYSQIFKNQVYEFLFYAGLMFTAIILFKYTTAGYKYYEPGRG